MTGVKIKVVKLDTGRALKVAVRGNSKKFATKRELIEEKVKEENEFRT